MERKREEGKERERESGKAVEREETNGTRSEREKKIERTRMISRFFKSTGVHPSPLE